MSTDFTITTENTNNTQGNLSITTSSNLTPQTFTYNTDTSYIKAETTITPNQLLRITDTNNVLISGTLQDDTTTPIQDANILIYGLDSNVTVLTDIDGYFNYTAMSLIVGTTYTIGASTETTDAYTGCSVSFGSVSLTDVLTITPNTVFQVLGTSNINISGTVTNTNNITVSGVPVNIYGLNTSISTNTDTNGNFSYTSFLLVPTNTYTLNANIGTLVYSSPSVSFGNITVSKIPTTINTNSLLQINGTSAIYLQGNVQNLYTNELISNVSVLINGLDTNVSVSTNGSGVFNYTTGNLVIGTTYYPNSIVSSNVYTSNVFTNNITINKINANVIIDNVNQLFGTRKLQITGNVINSTSSTLLSNETVNFYGLDTTYTTVTDTTGKFNFTTSNLSANTNYLLTSNLTSNIYTTSSSIPFKLTQVLTGNVVSYSVIPFTSNISILSSNRNQLYTSNSTISTSQSKFGNSSITNDITISSIGYSTFLNDFTIEFWFYSSTNNLNLISTINSNLFNITFNNTDLIVNNVSTPLTLPTDTWYHFACVFSYNQLAVFINGTRELLTNTIIYSSILDSLQIQADFIDTIRLSKSSTIYSIDSTSITVPNSSFTKNTDTLLINNFENVSTYINLSDPTITTLSSSETFSYYFYVVNAYLSNQVVLSGKNTSLDMTNVNSTLHINNILSYWTGLWTIEFWLYTTSFTDTVIIKSKTDNTIEMNLTNSGNITIKLGQGSSFNITSGSSTAITLNTWRHIALVWSGNNYIVYINGSAVITITSTVIVPVSTLNNFYFGPSNSYFSNLHISNSARYTSTFIPSTSMISRDYYSLVHNTFNGNVDTSDIITTENTNVVTTLPSINSIQYYQKSSNSIIQTSTQSKFGSYSLYIPSGNVLTIGDIGKNQLNTTWSLEYFFRNTNFSINTGDFLLNLNFSNSSISANINSSITTANVSIASNVWNHLLLTYSTSNINLFLNGNNVITTNSLINSSTMDVLQFNGNVFIDELRVSRIVRSNVVPSVAYTTDNSTVLLNHFENVSSSLLELSDDTLSSDFTINSSGTFNYRYLSYKNAALSTSNYKFGSASIYLDGNSYVIVDNINSGTLSSLTIDFWVYINSSSTSAGIVSSGSVFSILLNYNATTGKLEFSLGNGTSWTILNSVSTTNSVNLNSWNHIAIIIGSTTSYLFLNGVQEIYNFTWANPAGLTFNLSDSTLSNSVYYSGTGSRYIPTVNSTFSISGLPITGAENAWTVEIIFYAVNDGTGGIYPAQSMSNGTWQFAYNSSGRRSQFILGNGSTWFSVPSTALVINRNNWYHYAGVFDGTSYKFYGNGVLQNTVIKTTTNTVPYTSLSSVIFGNQFVGYIDSYSTSKIARYTSDFTMPTSLPIDSNTLAYFSFDSNAEVTTGYSTGFSMSVNALIFGASLNNRVNKLTGYYDEMLITPLQKYYGTFEPQVKAYNSRTTSTLLLNHFNGVDNSTSYFNSEETNYNISNPIYTLINGYITTSTFYFGSASLYLDNTSNLYINNLNLTTTYTIEFFYKFNSQVSGSNKYLFTLNTGESLYHSDTAWTHTTPSLSSTTAFDTSNWYYICYTRNGSTLNIRIINTSTNVVVALTGTSSTSAPTFINFNTNATSTMNIDSLRVSNTSTIITTVPSSEFSILASSTLLLNNFNGINGSVDLYQVDSIASSNLIQSSSNSFTTIYNLFNCYISNSIYKYGSGSIYFNGTDPYSYLSINLGQRYIRGNWTIELWFYPSTVGTCLLSFSTAFNTTQFLYVLLSGTGAISLTVNNTTSTGSTLSTLNSWNHFILSYDGTKYWVYLNGIYQFDITSSCLLDSMFYNNIIIGRQLIYNTDTTSYNSVYTYFSNQKNYIGFIDSIMITKSCKYSGTSNINSSIYNIPQTQTYYTVLFNHCESNDLLTSEDTNYVITVPSITLNSTVYVADTFNIISKETQLFDNPTIFIGNTRTFTLANIGSNYITGSWTFEFWLNGSFVSCPLISSSTQTVSSWTHFADSYDYTTNTRYSFINGTLNSNVSPNVYTLVYGNAFDSISITGNNTYIGSLKLSNLCNYTANFTPSVSQFTTDTNTVLMYYFNEPHGYQYNLSYNANANVSVQTIGSTSLWSSTYFYTPPNFWSSNNFTKLYNNIYYVSYDIYTPSGSIAFSNTRAMSGTTTSLYLNNNSGNFGRLRVVLNDNYILGDYTVEFWVNFATLTGYLIDLIGVGSPLTNNITGSTRVNGTNTTITTNTWYHIAIVYTNSDYNVYVNGILQFTLTNYLSNVNYFTIGQGAQFYMNRLRISNNSRYTSSFTASSSYTSDSNTISFNILNGTNGTSTLFDTENSVSSLTYSTIGTVSYTGKGAAYSETIQLFGNYSIYIPSISSGFVMTGLGSNSIITPWTIEFFIYKNPTFYIYNDSTTTVNPSTNISNIFHFTGSTFTINGFVCTYTTSNLVNDWNHYSIVFTGYQILLFVNGQVINFTVTKNSTSYNNLITIPSASLFNSIGVAINDGYFGGIRISNTPRYTDTFTVPTTSYTSDANTIFFNNFEMLSITAFLPRLTITPVSLTQPTGTQDLSITGLLRNATANINVANVNVSITGAGNLIATSNASGIFSTTASNLTIGSNYSLSANVSSNIYSSNITTLGNVTITNISLQLILNNIYQVFGTNRLYIDASLYNTASTSNIANISTNLYGLDTTYNLITDNNGLLSLTTGNLVAGNVYLLTSNLTSNTYSISGLNRRTQTTTNGNTYIYTTSSYNGNVVVLSNTRNQVYTLSGNSMMSTSQLKFGYASLSNAVAITAIGTSTFFANWTIEFWFYSTTNNLILRSLVNSNLFNITFNNTTLAITIGFVTSSVSLSLTTSTWLHCAIVFEVNQLAVFIDGTRQNLVTGVVSATVLDQLFVQSGFIDELRIVRDSTIYNYSSTSITVPTQPFTLSTSTLLLNHFNGANTSTDIMYFDDAIGIASYNYSSFSYYYSVKDAYLSNEQYLDTTNTSLALSTSSRVYIRNLQSYWNGLWTIQFWLNVSSFSNSVIFGSSLANSLELAITITGYLTLKLGRGTSWNITTLSTSTGSLSTGVWSHLALVYDGTYKLYLDGTSIISVSSVSIPQSSFLNNVYIGSVNGYLCNLQIDDTARYTTTFTPSTTMTSRDFYTLVQNSFDGTNLSTDIITTEDTNTVSTIPILNQNQIYTQSTTNMTVINGISQFGSGSLYMPSDSTLIINGIGGNNLTTNWTIEFFLRNSSQTFTVSDINNIFSITINSTTLTVTTYGATSSISNTLTTGWHYIAFVYNTSSWILYVNSISRITGTTLLPSYTFNTLIFSSTNGGCYIDELRISRVARSISTPSVAYTADSNTILLNHFENYTAPNVIDASDEILSKYTINSSNVFPYSYISYNNASLDTTTKKFGTASIYFDGTSGLIIDNIQVDLTKFWTLEFWVYILSGSSTGIVVSTNGNYGLQLLYNSSTSKLELSISTNGTSWNILNGISSTNTITTNTWNFITITADTSYKLFINGTQEIVYTYITTANNSDYGFTYNLISNVSFSRSVSYYQDGSLNLTSTSSPRGIVISASYNATNPWTIECFFYMTYMTGQNGVVMNSPTDDPAFGIVVESSNGTAGRICWLLGNNAVSGYSGWWNLGKSSTFNVYLNTWYHVAMTYDGSTYRLFLDGVLHLTNTTTNKITSSAFNNTAIGRYWSYPMTGYISHVKLSNTAKYTSAFTKPTSINYDNSTVFLVPLTTDNSLTYFDTSVYTTSNQSYQFSGSGFNFSTTTHYADGGSLNLSSGDFIITNSTLSNLIYSSSNVAINTTRSKFGNSSAFITGLSNGVGSIRIVNLPTSSFTGNWTYECWVYPTNARCAWGDGQQGIFCCKSQAPYTPFALIITPSNMRLQLFVSTTGTDWLINAIVGSTSISLNSWSHIAFVWDGSSYKVYLNGTVDINVSSTTAIPSANLDELYISNNSTIFSVQGLNNGYIDEVRVSSIARYTSNFTPTTTAFSSDANTIYLNHFEGTNNSTNWITGQETPSNSLDVALPWTIEIFVRIPSYVTRSLIFNGQYFHLAFINDGTIRLFLGDGINTWSYGQSSSVLSINVWYHIAVVYNGTDYRLYIDGTESTINRMTSTNKIGIGGAAFRTLNLSGTNRNISHLRLSNVAVYTTNFTKPTTLVPTVNTVIFAQLTTLSTLTAVPNLPAIATLSPLSLGYQKQSSSITTSSNVTVITSNASNYSFRFISNAGISKTVFFADNGSLDLTNVYSGNRGIVINGPTITSTNPWTIECFFRATTLNGQNGILQNGQWDSSILTGSQTSGFGIGCDSSNGTTGQITWLLGNSVGYGGWFDLGKSSTQPVQRNVWYHVAVSFDGTTYRLYLDGTLYLTNTSGTPIASDSFAYLAIGRYYNYQFTGYISHVRLSNIARYTSAFTRPTTLDYDANTVFFIPLTSDSPLTYQDSTVYTNTGLSYLLFGRSFSGTGPISFSSNIAYADNSSTALNFGSLQITNTNYIDTTRPWTMEFFVYLTRHDTYAFLSNESQLSSYKGLQMGPSLSSGSSTSSGYLTLGNGAAYYSVSGNQPYTWALNTWYHYAMVYTGNSYIEYQNGNIVNTVNAAPVGANSFTTFTLAGPNRHVSHLRLSNTAVYTSAFTKPTTLIPTPNSVIFAQLTNLQSNSASYTTYSNSLNTTNNNYANLYIDEINFLNVRKYYSSNFASPSLPLNYRTTSTLLLNHLNGNANSKTYFDSEETNYINTYPIYTLINGNISTSDYYFGTASVYLASSGYLYLNNLGLSTTYTIEFFYKFNSQVSGSTRYIFALSTGETLYHSGTAWTHLTPNLTSTATFDTSNWYYICYTRSGSTLTIKIINTSTNATVTLTGTATTGTPSNIYFYTNNTTTMYIDNLRISNTASIITTVPTSAYTTLSNSVVLINNFNGTNNSIDLVSTDALYSSVLTTSSSNSFTTSYQLYNCQVNNSNYKFGSSSLFIDGVSMFSFLTINLGQRYIRGNWTIEFWFYPITWGEDQTNGACLFCSSYTEFLGDTGNIPGLFVYIDNSVGKLNCNMYSTNRTGNTVVTKNTWHHFALVHNGNANYSVYLDGNREMNFTSYIIFDNVFTNPIIIGRQFVYNNTQSSLVSYSYYSQRFASKNNFTGYIDSLMISRVDKYSGSTITSYTTQQTQTYYTVLYNHFENTDLLQSEDTTYITAYTTPMPYLTSFNAFQGYWCFLSKEYTKFSPSSLYMHPNSQQNSFFYTGLGTNVILGSWTFEIWLYGTFISNTVICASNVSNPILTINTSIPSNLRPANGLTEWTYFAETFDASTGTRYTYVNGTLYITTTNAAIIYGSNFDQIMISTGGGYIDSFKLSDTALYTGATITNYNTAFVTDSNTVINKSFWGPHSLNVSRKDDSLWTFSSISPGILTDGQIYEISPYRSYTTNASVVYYTRYDVAIDTSEYASNSTGSCKIDNRTNNSIFIVGLTDNYIKGDFTFEFWFKPLTLNGVFISGFGTRSNVNSKRDDTYLSSGRINWRSATINSIINGTTTMNTSTWYHIAVVYRNATLLIYINGTLDITVSNIYYSGIETTRFRICTPSYGGSTEAAASGYVDTLRISTIARYTSSFTPSTTFTKDNYTVSLNTFDGTNGSTDLIATEDLTSVTLQYGTVSTDYTYSLSNAIINTSIGMFNSSSLYIPSGSNVQITGYNSNYLIDSWTIEYFCYSNTSILINVNGGNDKLQLNYNQGNNFNFFYDNLYLTERIVTNLSANVWNHVAIVYNNYQIKYYLNGSMSNIFANNTSFISDYVTKPSASLLTNLTFSSNNGYIDSMRISDSARYSGNSYVVPTSVFTVDANTIVLNNFNSSVATKLLYLTDPIISSNYNISIDTSLFTIFYIIYGSAALSSDQSKFGSQSLNIVSNSVVIVSGLAVSIWTIDFWFYLSSTTTQTLIASYDNPFNLSITYSTNKIIMYLGNGTSWSVNSTAGTATINTGTWYHLSLVYTGTSYVLYINGIVDRTITSATVITFTQLLIGAQDISYTNNTNGYIDELLITNSALRSGTFTPPTSAYNVRLSTYQVLNHFEGTTLINSEDTNFILQTVYVPSNPVTLYIPGYNTNGSTDLYTSTGFYAPIQYPVNINSVFSFSNITSKFGSTSILIPASNNTLVLPLSGVSCTQFTVDFWYSPRITVNTFSIVSIGNVTFSWNTTRLLTNYGTGTSPNNTINIGTWYYIQLFFTQTNITGFINGSQVHSFTHTSSPGNLNISNIILYVGYYNNFRFMNNSIVNVPMQSIDYSYNALQLSTENFKFGSSSLRFYICNSLTLQYLISSSNWTVEFWFYSSNMTNATVINNTLLQVILNNTSVSLVVNNFTTTSSSFSSIINTWNHIAIVESFNNVLLYLNGSMICSYAFNLTLSSLTLGNAFDGFIDELRISKYDVYTSNFSVPVSAFTFTDTAQVLNHFNGTNGSNVINMDDALIDFYGQTYETINDITYQNYNVVLSSNLSKFGTKSAYFNGISSYFTVNVPFTIGNYTLQAWIYINDFSSDMGIFGFYTPYNLFLTIQASTRKLLLYVSINGTSWNLNSTNLGTTTFNTNTWYWVSLSFNGRAWNVYVNNTFDYTLDYFNYDNNMFKSDIVVGRMIDNRGNYNQFNFNGYIDDFSVMSIAYTTVPTDVLVPYTYTLALNHFEGTTLSNSEDTSTKTSYTNPNALAYRYATQAPIYYSVVPLFNNNRAIATNYNSGNDILSITNVNSNLLNTSWTLETWLLWSSSGTGGTGQQGCNLYFGPVSLQPNGTFNNISAAQTAGIQYTSVINYVTNLAIAPLSFDTWNHIAITFDGNLTLKIYVNGIMYSTIPITIYANYFLFNGLRCTGGNFFSSVFINGLRVSNTVRYTSNFTVPTDFFTYDTNTLMLLNIPSNAPKWGVKYDIFDLVKYRVSNTYTSNTVTYYWVNNGTSIATTPASILGNNTALYCVNSTNSTDLGNSYATVVFSDYVMPGDFTIELWFYTPTIVRSNQCLFSFWFMGGNFIGTNLDYILANTAFGSISANTWNHFAICFDSINYTFTHYMNGIRTTTSSAYSWTRGNFFEIHPVPYWIQLGANMNNSQNFNGYISNFRISNCMRYIQNFTVPTSNFTRDMNTVILNPFNGTNSSVNLMTTENLSLVNYTNTIFNTSYSLSIANNVFVNTIIPMAYTTSFRPFTDAGGSLGIGNNIITINGLANNSCQNSWTYELWFMLSNQVSPLILLSSLTQLFTLYLQSVNSTTVQVLFFSQRSYDNDGNNGNYKNPMNYVQNYSLALNTWCHVAITFDGDTYRLFMGGTLLYSNFFYNKQNRILWNSFRLGANSSTNAFAGYITGLRLSNTCRYTTSFTPSTTAFTYDSDTIICNYFGSNLNKLEFYDIANQVNNVSFNANDTWYISNNATLSTAQFKFGSRSLYLSGNNSFVEVYPSLQWYGAFTIQLWFNLTAYVDNENPYLITSAHSQLDALSLYINKSTSRLELKMQGTSANNIYWSSNSNVTTNTWNHFAFCYDPVITNKSYAYLNGTLEGKFISTGANVVGISTDITFQANTTNILKALVIGRQAVSGSSGTTSTISSNSFNGYIDEFIFSNYPKYNSSTLPSTTQKTRDMYDLVFNTFESTTLIGGESTPVTYVYSPNYNYSFIDPYTNITNNTELTNKLSTFGMNSSLSFLNDQRRSITINNLVELGGSYTIEFWCYVSTITTPACIYTFFNNGYPGWVYVDANYNINLALHVWTLITSTTVKVIPNTWNHIAIQFDLVQTRIQVFLNGRCAISFATNTSGIYITSFKVIFRNYSANYNHNGAYYISELRISSTLRYSTPTYTVPTSIFTVDSNTLVLNHFNGIDKANNLTWYNDPILLGNTNLTFVTNPSGISYINFGTQLSNTQVRYGSTALSVNNAYLIMQNMIFTGTEWSIEMWYYPTTSSGTLLSDYRADYKLAIIHNASLYLYVGDDTSWSIVDGLTAGTNIATNTWHHVAVVFSGLTYYLYLNGNLELSVASTTNIQTA